MSLAISWTGEAQETFDGIVDLIDQKWGYKSATEFVSNVKGYNAHEYTAVHV